MSGMVPKHQKCTYWAPGAPDGFGGVTWAAPVVLKCRWADETTMIRNKAGVESVSKAQVWLDQSIDLAGRLYLGSSTATDPATLGLAAMEPQAIASLTDLGGVTREWRVWL